MENSLITFNLDTMASTLKKTAAWDGAQIAEIKDGIYQIAQFIGEFNWHSHGEDKLFIVYKGDITFTVKNEGIEQQYTLGPGDGLIIPANMERKRIATEPTLILTFDTSGHAGSHGTGPGQHTHDF